MLPKYDHDGRGTRITVASSDLKHPVVTKLQSDVTPLILKASRL